MCVVDGSIDQFTSTCPMCKAFPPTNARCPHKKETCRNRKLHPRHDVVYFKNAEVSMFNGCGYCKYAQTNPPANKSGYNNPGWPGCCRPPQPHEYNMIKPAEWFSVSVIHRVPIPPDVKTLLDQALKSLQTSASATRPPPAALSEKKSNVTHNHTIPGKMPTPNGSPRSSTIAIPTLKSRPGGSPQMKPSSLAGTGNGSASRLLNATTPNNADQHQQPGSAPASPPTSRRSGSIDKPMKRIEGFRTTPPGNTRKLSDLDGTNGTMMNTNQHQHQNQNLATPNARMAPQVTVTLSVPATQGKGVSDDALRRPSLKRRPSSMSSTHSITRETKEHILRGTSTVKTKNTSSSNSTSSPASRSVTNLSDNLKAMSLISTPTSSSLSPSSASISHSRTRSNRSSSSRSSSPSGSLPDTDPDTSTVTSEGFTDYLSDESDAELQRQAEIRAAQLEQNRVEEEEFKQARQQLTGIGLKPPQEWGDVSVGGVRVGTVPVGITSTPGRFGRRG